MTDETEQGVHAVKKKNWRHKDSKSSADVSFIHFYLINGFISNNIINRTI